MSISAINWALNVVRGINSTQKSILIALADRANEDNQCWPSYEDICERSCATRNAVSNALKVFEQKNLVTRQQRHNKSTIYTLNIASTEKHTAGSSTQFNTPSSTESDTSSGTESNTLTIKEPSKEPQKQKHGRFTPPQGVAKEPWQDWVAYRRKFKGPTTDRSLLLVANKLKEFTEEEQRQAVDLAIECGWKSVFPKKQNYDSEGDFSI